MHLTRASRNKVAFSLCLITTNNDVASAGCEAVPADGCAPEREFPGEVRTQGDSPGSIPCEDVTAPYLSRRLTRRAETLMAKLRDVVWQIPHTISLTRIVHCGRTLLVSTTYLQCLSPPIAVFSSFQFSSPGSSPTSSLRPSINGMAGLPWLVLSCRS